MRRLIARVVSVLHRGIRLFAVLQIFNFLLLPFGIFFPPGGGVGSQQIPMCPGWTAGSLSRAISSSLIPSPSVALADQCLSRKTECADARLGSSLMACSASCQARSNCCCAISSLRHPDPRQHMGGRDLQFALELGACVSGRTPSESTP